MALDEIDSTDKGIIYLLQQDARKRTVADIGEQVGVSSSTVTNRIDRLEEEGVIKGYHTIVDYTNAGLDHHLLVTATVPISEKEKLIDEIMEVSGIVPARSHQTLADFDQEWLSRMQGANILSRAAIEYRERITRDPTG